MQNSKSTATPAYSMPQCETRYLRGKETKMVQSYPNNVRLVVNLDTEESRLIGKHGKIDPVGTDEIDPVKTA